MVSSIVFLASLVSADGFLSTINRNQMSIMKEGLPKCKETQKLNTTCIDHNNHTCKKSEYKKYFGSCYLHCEDNRIDPKTSCLISLNSMDVSDNAGTTRCVFSIDCSDNDAKTCKKQKYLQNNPKSCPK